MGASQFITTVIRRGGSGSRLVGGGRGGGSESVEGQTDLIGDHVQSIELGSDQRDGDLTGDQVRIRADLDPPLASSYSIVDLSTTTKASREVRQDRGDDRFGMSGLDRHSMWFLALRRQGDIVPE